MATGSFIALIVGFAAVLWLAAVSDLRTRRIPNALSILALLAWPVVYLLDPNSAAFATSLAIPAGVFLLGFVLWRLGVLGGGDVKLFTVASLWVGPNLTLLLALTTAFAGGALALAALWLRSAEPAMLNAGGTLARRSFAFLRGTDEQSDIALPYGVAIAIGGTVALYQKLSALNLEII